MPNFIIKENEYGENRHRLYTEAIKMGKKKPKVSDNTIIVNRRANHEYFIEDRIEAGLELQGWEVKSLRAGKVQLTDSYVTLKFNEAWLLGALITPLNTASTHIKPEPQRTRKLLLHRTQIDKLIGAVERKGFTVVPTKLYWKNNRVKCEIGLAKGKKEHDKRQSEKERDWKREKARLLKG